MKKDFYLRQLLHNASVGEAIELLDQDLLDEVWISQEDDRLPEVVDDTERLPRQILNTRMYEVIATGRRHAPDGLEDNLLTLYSLTPISMKDFRSVIQLMLLHP